MFFFYFEIFMFKVFFSSNHYKKLITKSSQIFIDKKVVKQFFSIKILFLQCCTGEYIIGRGGQTAARELSLLWYIGYFLIAH